MRPQIQNLPTCDQKVKKIVYFLLDFGSNLALQVGLIRLPKSAQELTNNRQKIRIEFLVDVVFIRSAIFKSVVNKKHEHILEKHTPTKIVRNCRDSTKKT